MKQITVRQVANKHEFDLFIRFGNNLYKNSPYYVPDLEDDLRATFNPKTNGALAYSEIQPFLAWSDNKPVGRVAAFINKRTNEHWHQQTVRFSMLDFIDDQEVSAALLRAVEQWGKARGMEFVEGPLGFTDFDKEGMLLSDFDMIGSIITLYNYPYYPEHMDNAGYEKAVDWIQLRIKVPQTVPERFAKVADIVRKRMRLTVKQMTADDILKRGYGEKVFNLLNECYAPLFGFTPVDAQQITSILKKYLPLVDLRLVPIIENAAGELVGFAACVGSLSEAMQRTKGKMFPFGWFHLLSALKWKRSKIADLMLIGIRPDMQGKGVNALLFDYLIPICNQLKFEIAETGPQLEDNTKELSQFKNLETDTVKRRRCYRKRL